MRSAVFLMGLSVIALSGATGNYDQYPRATLVNSEIKIDLYLPDGQEGYYRGTRFDWSGVISQVEYKNHTYFEEWKDTHDPANHDDIIGPVEEFRTNGSALGYAEAKPGEPFIKIGIGLLEKPDEDVYSFGKKYKILRPGSWVINRGTDWIEFRQEFNTDDGWGYSYLKKINLTRNEPEFTIYHKLKNTGSKVIKTHQYNHNFFMIDKTNIGRNYKINFPFEPEIKRNLKDYIEVEGKNLVFKKDLETGSLFTELEGFNDTINHHQIIIQNLKTGAGVKINGDKPLDMFNFWTMSRTICPEPYIYMELDPGQSEEWITTYHFFVNE
ncbi:hypothetical protein GF312_05020 [Candidatus Poribacteria bacterium]|nr:hypothetical protein [Candidatus Poribacteria bacterium]